MGMGMGLGLGLGIPAPWARFMLQVRNNWTKADLARLLGFLSCPFPFFFVAT